MPWNLFWAAKRPDKNTWQQKMPHDILFSIKWNLNQGRNLFCYDGNFINCDDQTIGHKGQVHLVRNPSDSDFDDDSDVGDFGQFDDEFDEYGDNVTSDMEENKLFTYTEFSYTIDVG